MTDDSENSERSCSGTASSPCPCMITARQTALRAAKNHIRLRFRIILHAKLQFSADMNTNKKKMYHPESGSYGNLILSWPMSWDISLPVRGHHQGYTELNTTSHTRRVKTVFLAMRHALDDMQARQQCMDIMRELFRQFMSILIQEKTRVEEQHIYLDPRISFQEIDRYFLSGCACSFFQVATDVYTDLRYNQEEWD